MSDSLPNCVSCGRPIQPRKSHRGSADVRYCSKACRSRRISPLDRELEAEIAALLDARARSASLCPSEVARAVGSEDDWRGLMEPVRRAGRRLAARGEVVFTQRGKVVDPATVRGPIRIRRP